MQEPHTGTPDTFQNELKRFCCKPLLLDSVKWRHGIAGVVRAACPSKQACMPSSWSTMPSMMHGGGHRLNPFRQDLVMETGRPAATLQHSRQNTASGLVISKLVAARFRFEPDAGKRRTIRLDSSIGCRVNSSLECRVCLLPSSWLKLLAGSVFMHSRAGHKWTESKLSGTAAPPSKICERSQATHNGGKSHDH